MFRVNFYHTVLRKHPTTGVVEPLQNVEADWIRKINADGTEQSSNSPIYANREGATAGNPFSNANGIITFWLDPGDYNIYIVDTTVTPKRIVDSVVGVSAVSGAPGGILLSQLVAAVQEALIPAGTIVATGRSTMPSAGGEIPWLLCDGATYDNDDYPTLYAAIGTNYGTGGGATFKVPDLRGRVAVGVDGGIGRISTTLDTIGQSGGEDIHVLAEAELPSSGWFGDVVGIGGGGNVAGYGVDASGAPEAYVAYDITGGGGFFSSDFPYVGTDEAHNNMQPYLIINYMIHI